MMSDPDKRFAESVAVHLTPGNIRMVQSAREAAETLLYKWPDGPETAKRRAARAACLRALEGVAPPSDARKAFVAAARERGILVTGIRTR